MYKIFFNDLGNKYEAEELVKMFLPPSEYEVVKEQDELAALKPEDVLIALPDGLTEKNQGKRFLFDALSNALKTSPDWGTLTGVRPVKLAGEVVDRECGSFAAAERVLMDEYRVSREKAQLLTGLVKDQRAILGDCGSSAIGLYIGIPFCPTRCVYCSFPSNQVSYDKVRPYLEALHQEISFAGEEMAKAGWYPESVYIGGGTPTTLTAEDLSSLLVHIGKSFDLSKTREFTVEAGRPDTITLEKLSAIKENGGDRISINPQSMKERTLELIGRSHTPQQIRQAFEMAKAAEIPMVNADLIAGLPEESPKDFEKSLNEIIGLSPENITIHTLAVKRASKLKELAEGYNYRQGNTVREMLSIAREMLAGAGYAPYYLYRQKQMTGNFENVGYAKGNTASIYNIRIMEEHQTILALGAGGISKKYYPKENRLERVPNVTNYEIYIERLVEMLERKKKGIFVKEESSC